MQFALKQSVNQDQMGRVVAARQTEHPPIMQDDTNSGQSEKHEQVKYLENLTKVSVEHLCRRAGTDQIPGNSDKESVESPHTAAIETQQSARTQYARRQDPKRSA
jgi:hypothetical protein